MAPRVAIPTNAEELREQLMDKRIMRELLTDPEAFADHMEASYAIRAKHEPVVFDQVKEQQEAFMIEWLKNNGGKIDDTVAKRLNLDSMPRARMRPATLYNKKAIGAPRDDYFPSATDFIHAISEHSFKNADLSRKLETLKNDLSSMKPSDGGFLIPEILRAELLRVAMERAIVRSRARIIPMDSLTVPFPSIDSTSNVSSIYGGIVGFWTEEGATLTESQPRFGRVELRAQKLCLYTEVPNELIRDAMLALETFIGEVMPEAIAWFEDVAFFIGSGVGEPLGFLNAPARIQVARNAGGLAIEWVDIVNMFSRLLPQSFDRAVWVVAPDALPSLFQMTLAGGTSPVFFGSGTALPGSQQPPMSLLGIPIVVSEKARAVGTPGDINLVDFSFYLLGDRQAMSARQSEEFRFQNDLTAFRVIERVDGRPWLQSAITPQNGSANTLSPFVQLTA